MTVPLTEQPDYPALLRRELDRLGQDTVPTLARRLGANEYEIALALQGMIARGEVKRTRGWGRGRPWQYELVDR